MPGVLTYTNSGSLAIANAVRALGDDSVLRLFKSGLNVSRTTSRDELLAAECDFSGYPAGGLAITTWTAPVLSTQGGYTITIGQKQFIRNGVLPGVNNVVGGFWIEFSDGTVLAVGQFGVPQPMQVAGAGLPIQFGQQLGV